MTLSNQDIFASFSKETDYSKEGLNIDQSASDKISNTKVDGERLRIKVTGGGCSGYTISYVMNDMKNDDDVIFNVNGAEVIADHASMKFLGGATLFYKETLMQSGFSIESPYINSSCGCGTSFSFKK